MRRFDLFTVGLWQEDGDDGGNEPDATAVASGAATNPRTRFLVYSRGRIWPNNATEVTWIRDVAARFPHLNGRLFTMVVPGQSAATFRDPRTAQLLRTRVQEILGLR